MRPTTYRITKNATRMMLRARPTPVRLLGLVVGFAGALLIAEPWTADGSSSGGELACLAAAASYGVSYVYMARYTTPRAVSVSPFVLAYGQMIASTTLLIPVVLVAGRQPLDLTGDVIGRHAVLGFVGIGLAYVINYALIARDGATVASTVTTFFPSSPSPSARCSTRRSPSRWSSARPSCSWEFCTLGERA